ncbi:MAG TPA: GNAT family N-acetyltransferase [Fimbriimonas sp.]|nr:GNAT family N-acetyltransferase [Fimbriimonas sp.]
MASVRLADHGTADYLQTVKLRLSVLREPLGLSFSEEELAAEEGDFHVAAFEEDWLVGCLVLVPGEGRIKMRQVAVIEAKQGRGIGTAMVQWSESLARDHGFSTMYLHARDTAVAFYLRLGYQLVGEPFVEVGIPHRKMEKAL